MTGASFNLPAALLCLSLASQSPLAAQTQPPSATLDRAETSGIDGRDVDRTFPGATTVDAVHRSVLVRFADADAVIGKWHEEGYVVDRATVSLGYSGYEVLPQGYVARPSPRWKNEPPRWHLVAWALRRPWTSDVRLGPTFNAHAATAGYWSRYGAADEASDRYPRRFGPVELSAQAPTATIDVTEILTSPDYGKDARLRARSFAENGLLLAKLETYDARYRDASDAYEWAVPTGGHGLTFRNASLAVSFRKAATGKQAPDPLPPPAIGSGPTAILFSSEQWKGLADKLSLDARMAPGWQKDRVLELAHVGGGVIGNWTQAIETRDYPRYAKLVKEILATPPRYWKGWDIADELLLWHLHGDLLPQFVRDHMLAYWRSWLMPDIPTAELFHPQSKEAFDYWKRTGDWRGRASFFRDGYNFTTSTQNFNHTAAMGALLGGALIGSRAAMDDGRHGLEEFPLRLWTMRDGSTQEMLDHYYLSITLSAQKMFADYGPTALDRLMGRIMVDRTMEMLATAYHPNLRRVLGASGRASLQGVLATQEGIYGALHTLSRKGTLRYADRPIQSLIGGMRLWGRDFPPGRVAMQAVQSPWAAEWLGNVLDNKTFPWEEISTETTRGAFRPPLWRRTFLGRHYGLASQDLKGGTVDVLAQWNSRAEPSESIDDLGTLTARYAVNRCDMATTRGGTMPYAGALSTFQHRNRAIVFMKPRDEAARIEQLAGPEGLSSLASVIAIWNFNDKPDWQVRIDGRKVESLPAKARAGQVITIKHGVSYLGIVPLRATNLGRDDEVVIGRGCAGRSEPNGALIEPALTITSYNFQKAAAVPFDQLDWPAITKASYGGFVIELGDAHEYPSFEAFERRMRANRVAESWDSTSKIASISYTSGKDLLEAGFSTSYAQADAHFGVVPGEQVKAIPYRRINGAWPYLPAGIERDTPIAQQGTTGRLEKNGAILRTESGRKAYLQADAGTGAFTGYNPLPDPTPWALELPGGMTIEALGKVGLLRLAVWPRESRMTIDYAVKPQQAGEEMATHLLVRGAVAPLKVTLNGEPASVQPLQGAYRIPLFPQATR